MGIHLPPGALQSLTIQTGPCNIYPANVRHGIRPMRFSAYSPIYIILLGTPFIRQSSKIKVLLKIELREILAW